MISFNSRFEGGGGMGWDGMGFWGMTMAIEGEDAGELEALRGGDVQHSQ